MHVKFNAKSRMMEIEFLFREVNEANLFRNIYPYNELPRLMFNHRSYTMNIPDKLDITDTTFRDGQQSRTPYTTEAISHLSGLSYNLDNGSGVIRQSEFFLYTE